MSKKETFVIEKEVQVSARNWEIYKLYQTGTTSKAKIGRHYDISRQRVWSIIQDINKKLLRG